MSRKIEDLVPELQVLYYKWADEMEAANIDFLITCTSRTLGEQTALYARGRSEPGPKVTWTMKSKHLTGEAFDFVVMLPGGKPDWQMTLKDEWKKAVEFGKELGLMQVIGKDGQVKEQAHLQLRTV